MGKKKEEVRQCVTREYICDNTECLSAFEVREPIHQKARKKCPICGKYKLRRVFQIPHIISETVTLGSWGEKNRRRIGNSEIQQREAIEAERKISVEQALAEKPLPPGMKRIPKYNGPAPWWRPNTKGPDKGVMKMTQKEKSEFILTGKRPIGK